MTIDQISVFVENREGRLAEITKILGEKGIDLRAMSIADTADFGILRLIVDQPERALKILREADCIVSVTEVIAVPIEDKPGSLAKVLEILSKAEVSIEYSYAFVTRKIGLAYVVMRIEKFQEAIEALAEHDIKTASGADIYDI